MSLRARATRNRRSTSTACCAAAGWASAESAGATPVIPAATTRFARDPRGPRDTPAPPFERLVPDPDRGGPRARRLLCWAERRIAGNERRGGHPNPAGGNPLAAGDADRAV